MNHKIALSVLLFALATGCGGGKAAPSACSKAASALGGIVMLEVPGVTKDPKELDRFEAELTAECKATKLEETAKEALECYDENHSKIGYRLFKACPEQPGRALIDAVVAKH
jgi:hypothetical protein